VILTVEVFFIFANTMSYGNRDFNLGSAYYPRRLIGDEGFIPANM